VSLLHPVHIGSTETPGNLFLAPVAGYTDRAYRSICVELGADLCFTELISSEALVRDSSKTLGLMERAANEKLYAIQLFGSDPSVMARATSLLAPFHPEYVDVNCGCPVPKVVKTGAGSALLRDPAALGRVVEAVANAAVRLPGSPPVTVKIRTGWDDSSINFLENGRIAVESGATMVSLHARTRVQAYSGYAKWEYIAELASALTVPVCGSGDLYTPDDAERMLSTTGCAAVMFARGAMGNPFIFEASRARLSGRPKPSVPVGRKMDYAFKQLALRAADVGESVACREMRKQFCAYTKGVGGGSALRERLVHCSTTEEYRSVVADLIDSRS